MASKEFRQFGRGFDCQEGFVEQRGGEFGILSRESRVGSGHRMLIGRLRRIVPKPGAQRLGRLERVEDVGEDGFGSGGEQGFEHGASTETRSVDGDYSIMG